MTDSRIVVYFDMYEDAPRVSSEIVGVYTIQLTSASVVGKYNIIKPIIGYFDNCGFEIGDLTNWSNFTSPASGTNATVDVDECAYYGNYGCELSAGPEEGLWCSGYIRPATLSLSEGDKLTFRYKIAQSTGTCSFKVWIAGTEENTMLIDATSPATTDWLEYSINTEDFPSDVNLSDVALIFYVIAGA